MARPLSMLELVTSWITNHPTLTPAEATRLIAELEPIFTRSLPEDLKRPPLLEKPLG